MSRLLSLGELARLTGIPRTTLLGIAVREPHLTTRRGRTTYFVLSKLAEKPGMGVIETLTLADGPRWVKLVDLAQISGIPRRTLATWAKTRPNFACRIGRIWYVRLETLGASPEQQKFFERWSQKVDSGQNEEITED